jgi:hypothetical protein
MSAAGIRLGDLVAGVVTPPSASEGDSQCAEAGDTVETNGSDCPDCTGISQPAVP